MSESSSSEEDSEFFYQKETLPYRFEPDYSKEEVEARKRGLRERTEAEEAATVRIPSRTEDKSWCTCDRCVLMPTDTECVCCHDLEQAKEMIQKFDPATDETDSSQHQQKCVTQHPDFEAHLNEGVLDTYFRSHQYNWRKFPKPRGPGGTLTNAQYRLVAYRFILDWLLKGERLGKKKRMPLPACTVNRIREKYPADNNDYAGFQFAADLPTV